MLKKLALYFGLAVGLNMNAFALVGGPFDGGDYNLGLDDSGVYQASYRFKNGSGFGQWANNSDPRPFQSTGAGTSSISGSVISRTLLYYKGISFFGGASGIVDIAARRISGMSNTFAEATFQSQAGNTVDGSITATPVVTTAAANGGRGFVANLTWSGKITDTHPQLRFSGNGRLTILSPDVSAIISELAQTLAEQVQDDVGIVIGDDDTSSLEPPDTGLIIPADPIAGTPQNNAEYIAAYNSYLAAVQAGAGDDAPIDNSNPLDILSDPNFIDAITPQTLEEVQASSETVKVKVYGSRRFFNGVRQG